jgi:hypothetical protein
MGELNTELKEQLLVEIETRIEKAIDERKREVSRQLRIWAYTVTTVFGALTLLGINSEFLIKRLRDTILPKTHIVSTLIADDKESESLRENIINELSQENIGNYQNVLSSIHAEVWQTIIAAEENDINKFLEQSSLDDRIVDRHYDDVIDVLFGPNKPSSRTKQIEFVKSNSKRKEPVLIGFYENKSNSDTACLKQWDSNKDIVIVAFPYTSKVSRQNGGQEKLVDAIPWYKCPWHGYPTIVVTLRIDDIEIKGVRVVGVERVSSEPSNGNKIHGVRARVSKAVADKFKAEGVDISDGVFPGFMSIYDAF